MNRNHNKHVQKVEKRSEQRTLSERLGTVLDIPADLLCGGCYLELRGQNDLHLQGCRKILVYTDEEIVLRLRRGCVRLRGRRLVCSSYHAGAVVIEGWITSIDFIDGEGTDK